MTSRICPGTRKFRTRFANWHCACSNRSWKRRAEGTAAIETIRSDLRTLGAGEDDRRGGTVRESDAAEPRRFCVHAGGRLQNYPGESSDCGGAGGKIVPVIA